MSSKITCKNPDCKRRLYHKILRQRIYDKIFSAREQEFCTFLELQGIKSNDFTLEIFDRNQGAWNTHVEKIVDFKIGAMDRVNWFCIELTTDNNKSLKLSAITYIDERNLMCVINGNWCVVRFSNAK